MTINNTMIDVMRVGKRNDDFIVFIGGSGRMTSSQRNVPPEYRPTTIHTQVVLLAGRTESIKKGHDFAARFNLARLLPLHHKHHKLAFLITVNINNNLHQRTMRLRLPPTAILLLILLLIALCTKCIRCQEFESTKNYYRPKFSSRRASGGRFM